MDEKTKEQFLEELSAFQKMLEKKTETRDHMIKKFQLLIANNGLFSQIIDSFPYPIAIFTPQHTLTMVNKAFAAETKIRLIDLEKGAVRILPYKINNMRLAEAVARVFAGDTFFLEDLNDTPLILLGIIPKGAPQSRHFNKAVVFPVPSDNDKITHGVIAFMP
jgi:PAS domain-containing protein